MIGYHACAKFRVAYERPGLATDSCFLTSSDICAAFACPLALSDMDSEISVAVRPGGEFCTGCARFRQDHRTCDPEGDRQ